MTFAVVPAGRKVIVSQLAKWLVRVASDFLRQSAEQRLVSDQKKSPEARLSDSGKLSPPVS